ncbi:hypothetical protein BJY04DRAFT_137839 [Aspergillus karnatakaensis]|uniref:uncharacterized protein n=1 Tax=Aspergillus karnatakaensis TaxID=1810916 RepID=UPI003CCCE64C
MSFIRSQEFWQDPPTPPRDDPLESQTFVPPLQCEPRRIFSPKTVVYDDRVFFREECRWLTARCGHRPVRSLFGDGFADERMRNGR